MFLMGDFNASVGADHRGWGDVIGKHGVWTANSTGLRLLNTCSEFDFVITSSSFQKRNQYKTTWTHLRS